MGFLKNLKWGVRKEETLEERAAKDMKVIKDGVDEIMEISYTSMSELVDMDDDNEYTRLMKRYRELTDASMDLMSVYADTIVEMKSKQDESIDKLDEISQQLRLLSEQR